MAKSIPLSLAGLWLVASLAGCAWRSDPDLNARLSRMRWQTTAPVTAAGPAATQPDGPLAEEIPANADVQVYLRVAAERNPGLEAAFARWKAAVERIPQVRALPDPRLNYRYFIEEVETRVGPQRQSVELSQTFPWFGKLDARGDAASAAAMALWQQYQAARLALFYQVKSAYYEYWYIERAIAVTRENVELLGYVEKVMQRRYAGAAAGQPDVIRLQVEQGRLADRLRTLQRGREPIVARLNAAMNRPVNAPLSPPGPIVGPVAVASDAQLLDWLRQSNPRIQALEQEIDQQRQLVRLAKKEYFPDLTLGAGMIDTREAVMRPRPADSGQDPVYVMLSLNLPIWQQKLAAGVREAKWNWLAAASRRDELANSLAAELEMALFRFHDAQFKIDLYRDALLPKAVQAQQSADAAFRAAKLGYTDLIDTQRVLLEFQLALARAIADRNARLAEIEMLVGRDISSPAGNPAPASPVINSETVVPPATQPD